ncbi:MAG: bifunctional adenosylcobinamide kinase/adenosylcobinamide-phosphate guanylyltransferase [Oscillospiraceae bacterium]|nr:bifunctional adenosylcobinamide kinase/adenosylcobinamide-phosphate guanylyltransferase [Oscillospiraceae bacterium]
MSKTILITGGAASGKSRWAVSYLAACDYVLYLRTADAVDADTMNRIEYSNKQNYVEWDIRTGITENPAEQITDHKFVIFDNLAAYTSLVISQMCPDVSKIDEPTKKAIEKKVISDVTEMYDKIMVIDGNMITITLETGFSVTPEDRTQAVFREILGNVNQRIANMSNEVYLSASGIQFQIK